MKRVITLLIALVPVLVYAEPVHEFAVTNVTVIPMDEDRVLPAQTVIIRDGLIAEVGPANRVSVPRDMQTVDGRGRYLMPGLAEMHAHVPPQTNQQQWTEDILFLYVANGITFARSMLGAPHHIALRESAASGEIVSPRLYLSGPSFNGNSVASPAMGRDMVAAQKEAGYDFLKIHPGLDADRFDAIVAAAREHDMTFGGHVSNQVGVLRAMRSGQATIDHLDEYIPAMLSDGATASGQASMFFGWNLADGVDERAIDVVAAMTRDAGTWNVPTESLIQHVLSAALPPEMLAEREEMRYVPRPMVAQWVQAKRNIMGNPAYSAEQIEHFIEIRAKLIKALHDAGAGLLLGSDAPQIFNVPGFAIHHELRMLVEAGLSPFDALATGNRNVARFLGEESVFGTVEAGKRADLILLERNPLIDVANVQHRAGVVVNGRWISEEEIQEGLAEIAARYQD